MNGQPGTTGIYASVLGRVIAQNEAPDAQASPETGQDHRVSSEVYADLVVQAAPDQATCVIAGRLSPNPIVACCTPQTQPSQPGRTSYRPLMH